MNQISAGPMAFDNKHEMGADPAAPTRGALALRMPLLVQYLSIVRRRKWIIMGAVAAALVLGLIVTLLMTPKYTASTTIEIQREQRNFTNVAGANESSQAAPLDNEFYQTQYGLLVARSLADRVVVTMKLQDDEAFFQRFKDRDAKGWFENGRVKPGASTRDRRIREAGDVLLDHISVDPGRLSRLVELHFTSPDPDFSRRVVDTWASKFIELTLERRFEATSYARKFLEERLAQLRTRIDTAERQLVDYASQQGIVNLPATTPASGEGGVQGERSLAADDLAAINRELSKATADRVQAQSRLSESGGASSEALDNEAISNLRGKRADLAADYAKLMVQFEPDYPPAKALQTQIAQIDRSLGREESRVSQSLRETYSAATQRERVLRDQVGSLKTGVLDLRRRSIQYNIFQRDVDTSRQLYDALLQRYKEIGVAGGVGVNNISIVDPAELPQKPSSPRFALNMLLALLTGIVVGGAAAFALEQIDQGVSDPSEVEGELDVPLLGTIPNLSDGDPLEALQDKKSSVSEAYISLLTSLAFSTDHGIPRSLAVTSTQPAEGKTTTSYAIARSIGRTGRRVLLIDADMRSPSIHELLGVGNDKGLSSYLSGADELAPLIVATAFENVSVMPAGPHPPSAPELLAGERLGRLVTEALAAFDHVVFDIPPVMGLADAPLVASKTEGVVFVIESRNTQKGMARVAIERLRAVHASIIGVALTKFDARGAHYGYGYDYGYGYGEGAASSR